MLKKYLKNQKGLTLIELLAVIVILGIIAAIAVPAIGSVIEKTRLDAVRADAMQVLDAAKLKVASEGVPDSGTFIKDGSIDDLENFIEEVKTLNTYTVHVNPAGTEYKISFTTNKISGKVYATATNVTLSDADLDNNDVFEDDTKITVTE